MKTKALSFVLAVLALCLPSLNAQNQGKPDRGVVSVIVGTSITIASDKQGEMAYATNKQTKILKLDGSAGKLADVAPGATVLVFTGSDINLATEIQLVKPKVVEKPKKKS